MCVRLRIGSSIVFQFTAAYLALPHRILLLVKTEQKHVVKVGPMAPLAAALQEACSKFRPALDPGRCLVQYQKKHVEINTPFRLLNIPAGSRLDVTGELPLAGA